MSARPASRESGGQERGGKAHSGSTDRKPTRGLEPRDPATSVDQVPSPVAPSHAKPHAPRNPRGYGGGRSPATQTHRPRACPNRPGQIQTHTSCFSVTARASRPRLATYGRFGLRLTRGHRSQGTRVTTARRPDSVRSSASRQSTRWSVASEMVTRSPQRPNRQSPHLAIATSTSA